MTLLPTARRVVLPLAGVLALTYLLTRLLPVLDADGREIVRWWGGEALYLAGAAGCLARAALVPRARTPWLLMGGGVAAYAVGSLIGVISDRPVDDPPIAAYVGWLLFYAAAYPALLLLLRHRLTSFSFSFWLDGLVGALTVGALCVAFVPPDLGDIGTAKAIAGLAFPGLDLVLLSIVLWACALTGWRGGQWLWLGAALAATSVGDIVLDLQVLHDDFDPMSPVSICFALAMLAIGVAAWRPDAPPRALRTDTLAVLAMPGACVLVVLCVLLVGDTSDPVTRGLGLGAVAVACLRGVLSFGDLRSLHKNRRFKRGFDEAAIGMALVSPDLRWVRVNAATCRLLGRSRDELLGRSVLDVTHPDDVAASLALRGALASGGATRPLEKRMVRPDGQVITVEISSALVDGDDEQEGRLFFTQIIDRTQRRRAEGHATTLARISHAALELPDAAGITAAVTEAVREAMPARACHLELEPADDGARGGHRLGARVRRRAGAPATLIVTRDAEARSFDDSDARFLSAAANLLGAALDRTAVEDELRAQALEDPLTGLANRSYLAAHVEQAINSVGRGEHIGLLLLDLDRFKVINDTLGHGAGDDLLCAVAERLRETVRRGDLVARLGGDEFVVACTSRDDGGARIAVLAQRLLDALVEPYIIDGRELHLSASAGLVFLDQRGEATAESLLRDADVAMYRAKEHGGARFEVFDAGLRARVVQRLATESALRRALDRDELLLHFQPIMHLSEPRLVGFEALVRWGHPDRGLILPADFIAVAEETGLIVPTGRWVLRAAIAALVALEAEAGRPLRMAVNLSARQLSPTLVEEVREVLAEAGVPPSALTLEVTETLLVEGPGALEILGALRDLGVTIAIDDFGTGWSSLGALQRYPADVLKLDRSLVAPAAGSEPSAALARAVIEMGQALGLDVVAEGIEDASQLGAMQDLGCPHGQGFIFARPMSLDDAVELVGAGAPA